uniref:Transposase (Putative), gypsy type n=1 Tax=Tanacetum cinerariifolium TaxID=118510 RepID=A0A6L2P0X0_TANCI|nr:hypothetical protein [Tanacetum cinerariifolium]
MPSTRVSVSDAILGTQSREFRRLAPVSLPEDLPEILSKISFDASFGHPRRHVPPILCEQLLGDCMILNLLRCLVRMYVRFVPLPFILLTFPFPPYYMSFGPQTTGDVVVPKFDMDVYTSVLIPGEVKNLVAEYAIPSDLHPCVPPSDRFFLIDRAIPDAMPWRHQDSSMADPPPTGVRDEDIRRLCGHVIDLRPVHPAMLYAVGLTTIRKHVGHHPVFKDGERNVATSMSEFLKFLIAGRVRVGKGTKLADNEVIPQHSTPYLPSKAQIHEKTDHRRVIGYENERVLAAKRKAQAAKDRAAGKRSAAEGTSHPTKKKKRAHMTFALDDSEEDDSNRTELHHDAGDEQGHQHAFGSSGKLSAIFLIAFPCFLSTNFALFQVMRSFRAEATQPSLFVSAWKLTTHSILNDAESCRDMMIHLATPAVRAQQIRLSDHQALQRSCRNKLADDHKHLQQEHLSCVGKEVGLVDKLAAMEKEKDDLLDKNREQEERIKRLEEELASKSSSLIKAESFVSELKGNLDNEYKKSLSDVFNQAIASGWSEGVKVERTQEEAEAILATAADYDPGCKDTFMSAFDSLFTQSYPYVEKLTESFRLPLEDL